LVERNLIHDLEPGSKPCKEDRRSAVLCLRFSENKVDMKMVPINKLSNVQNSTRGKGVRKTWPIRCYASTCYTCCCFKFCSVL